MPRGKLRFRILEATAVAIPAGASVNVEMPVGAFDYLLTGVSVIPGQGINTTRINIEDTDGTALFSGRVRDQQMSGINFDTRLVMDGDSSRPGIDGILMSRNSTVRVNIENTDAAANTVDVVLYGYERR